MVLAGIGCEEEIRTAVVGSHPRAVHAHLGEGQAHAGEELVPVASALGALSQILDHIDQRFAGLGLGIGVLRPILFNVELDFFGAAGSFGGGEGGLVLGYGMGESGSGEKDQNESGFHSVPPAGNCVASVDWD